jgi:hypothetical protein
VQTSVTINLRCVTSQKSEDLIMILFELCVSELKITSHNPRTRSKKRLGMKLTNKCHYKNYKPCKARIFGLTQELNNHEIKHTELISKLHNPNHSDF